MRSVWLLAKAYAAIVLTEAGTVLVSAGFIRVGVFGRCEGPMGQKIFVFLWREKAKRV